MGDDEQRSGECCGSAALASESNLETHASDSANSALKGCVTEQLQKEIMAGLEAVLATKSESLWKRGQAELKKLQQERDQVTSSLQELQDRQEILMVEHTAMRNALLDITSKLEFVVTEMREALRVLPRRMSSGYDPMNGFTPPPVVMPALEMPCNGTSNTTLGVQTPMELPAACAAASAACAAARAIAAAVAIPPQADVGDAAVEKVLEIPEAVPDGPRTPPRAGARAADAASRMHAVTSGLPQNTSSHPGSPAMLLSLASALPSVVTPPPPGPPPKQPSKRLHIAECLDFNGLQDATNVCSRGNRVNAGTPTNLTLDSFVIGETAAHAAAQAAKLRAEAPAFVPGMDTSSINAAAVPVGLAAAEEGAEAWMPNNISMRR